MDIEATTIEKQARQMQLLQEKLDAVLARLEKIESGTDTMVNHVHFVMNIYEKIKAPFFFLMNFTANMLPVSSSEPRFIIDID